MLLLKPLFLLNKHYSNDCYGKRYLKHILTKTSLTAPLRLMISSGVSRYSPLCNHRLFCLRAIVFSFSHVALGVCEVKGEHVMRYIVNTGMAPIVQLVSPTITAGRVVSPAERYWGLLQIVTNTKRKTKQTISQTIHLLYF